jgi:hypothetical protein
LTLTLSFVSKRESRAIQISFFTVSTSSSL